MKKSILAILALLSVLASPAHARQAQGDSDPNTDFDRLDGTGESRKKVDVIEWEGNLEVHVYPKGSLKGLALKLDNRDDKSVLVIGYRFDNQPKKQLIRRAILGIDLKPGFRAFRDPSAIDYDKIVISNNGLSNQVAHYKLDPEPKQLYPDGHPENRVEHASITQTQQDGAHRIPAASKPKPTEIDEYGTIKPFSW